MDEDDIFYYKRMYNNVDSFDIFGPQINVDNYVKRMESAVMIFSDIILEDLTMPKEIAMQIFPAINFYKELHEIRQTLETQTIASTSLPPIAPSIPKPPPTLNRTGKAWGIGQIKDFKSELDYDPVEEVIRGPNKVRIMTTLILAKFAFKKCCHYLECTCQDNEICSCIIKPTCPCHNRFL